MTSTETTTTAALAASTDREVTMSHTTTTQCPAFVCTCGGTQFVTVKAGTDRRTGRATLTYSPCAALVAQGWSGNVATVAWA